MKKLFTTLTLLLSLTLSAHAMSYEQARERALFLTDKMAYELNLTDEQYEAAYEINLDYLMSVTSADDVYGPYWEYRNADLSYILLDWQYRAYLAASYFYRPLYWSAGYWHFGIYARYPYRDYFYFGRPHFYVTYRGGHSWHMNGGRSWYHGRDFGPKPGGNHFGMRDGFNRGDFGRGQRGGHQPGGARPGQGTGQARPGNGQPGQGHGAGQGGSQHKPGQFGGQSQNNGGTHSGMNGTRPGTNSGRTDGMTPHNGSLTVPESSTRTTGQNGHFGTNRDIHTGGTSTMPSTPRTRFGGSTTTTRPSTSTSRPQTGSTMGGFNNRGTSTGSRFSGGGSRSITPSSGSSRPMGSGMGSRGSSTSGRSFGGSSHSSGGSHSGGGHFGSRR